MVKISHAVPPIARGVEERYHTLAGYEPSIASDARKGGNPIRPPPIISCREPMLAEPSGDKRGLFHIYTERRPRNIIYPPSNSPTGSSKKEETVLIFDRSFSADIGIELTRDGPQIFVNSVDGEVFQFTMYPHHAVELRPEQAARFVGLVERGLFSWNLYGVMNDSSKPHVVELTIHHIADIMERKRSGHLFLTRSDLVHFGSIDRVEIIEKYR